jgi:hypothetical protein
MYNEGSLYTKLAGNLINCHKILKAFDKFEPLLAMERSYCDN